jgi:hypothetical protein
MLDKKIERNKKIKFLQIKEDSVYTDEDFIYNKKDRLII